MSRIKLMLACFLLLPLLTFANPSIDNQITNVIYITLDGTRWQDIYLDHSHFQKLWSKYADQGTFYGAPSSDTTMEVASVPVSLPSYQSQMSGTVQLCPNNSCGRILVETLPENLLHKLGLQRKEVAIFSSWPVIDFASEHTSGTTFLNTGNFPMYSPDTNQADAEMLALNQKQAADHPGDYVRYDKYTFAQALHYLEKYQPRFLWISFNDADDAAHKNNLDRYHQALGFYDDSLDLLFTTLKNMHIEKNTLVILTTDHGRGNGKNWTRHGAAYPESKQTWAFVLKGKLKPISQDGKIEKYSTLSIRPTVEAALGV